MKSNMYKMIVTCMCIWAVGMATDENQEVKSIERDGSVISKGINSLTKAEFNAKMNDVNSPKKKEIKENTLETKLMKDSAYKNAKREAAMQSEKKSAFI